MMETPKCWTCQSTETSAEENCTQEMQPAQDRDIMFKATSERGRVIQIL